MKETDLVKPVHPKYTVSDWDSLSIETKRELRQTFSREHDAYNAATSYTNSDFNRRRSWVILRRSGDKLYGLCENSFSMSWELNRVNVVRSYLYKNGPFSLKEFRESGAKIADKLKADVLLYKSRHPDDDIFIARVGSKNCPIKVDWRGIKASKVSKYDYRNLPFTIK